MKESISNIKDRIVLGCIEIIENPKNTDKQAIQEDLKIMAKHFNVNVKRVAKIHVVVALKQFLENSQGYAVTINKLYYSL